jgi:hypothetical protein
MLPIFRFAVKAPGVTPISVSEGRDLACGGHGAGTLKGRQPTFFSENWRHFAVGAAVSSFALWYTSPAWADASPPPASCDNGNNWHVVGYDSDQYAGTMSGVRTDVWFGDEHDCNRVSSISVIGPDHSSDDFQFFEFGWITGNTYAYCDGQYYHNPTLFVSYSRKGEATQCGVYPNKQPSPGMFHYMRASDENENSYWGAYLNGNEIDASVKDMDFHQGVAIASTERGNSNDIAFGIFKNLSEHHTDNGWTPWDNVRLYPYNGDSDPGYHFDRQASDWFKVVAD